MTSPLNIISLSGASNASANGNSASAAGAGDAESGEFQSLLAVLLNLLGSGEGGETGLSDQMQAALAAANADGAITGSTEAGQNSSSVFDLGGLIDLSALLDLKAQLNADADLSAVNGDGAPDTPDPLAAVLDLFIGALQAATDASPEGTPLTLDAKSADALKALNALLASLSEKTPVQLPPETVDKLTKLDQLLAGQSDSAELAELKTRIANLLGSSTSPDAKKASATDPNQPGVAALLGQDAKQQPTTQRDAMVHVLDGARANLKTTGESGTGGGDSTGQNQQQAASQAQNARTEHAARQPTAGAGDFAAQLAANTTDTAKSGDTTGDTIVTLASQGAERTQTSARFLPTAYNQAANRVDIPQIAFEIARHAANGVSRFEIRLDPPEMGRIDVRLDVDKSGTVNARLTVERAETLDLLQRDAKALERALSQSGLDNSKTNLEFSLRQNPFARQDSGQGQNQQDMASLYGDADATASETETPVPPAVTLYRGFARPGGVNLVA